MKYVTMKWKVKVSSLLKVSWRFNSPNKYEFWNFHGGMKLPKNVSFEFSRLKIAKSCEMTRNRYNFQKSKKFLTCGKRRRLFLVFQLLMLMMSTISTMPVPVMMMATVIIVLTLAATHDVKAAILHF